MKQARDVDTAGSAKRQAEQQADMHQSASTVLSAKAAAEVLGMSAKTLANWRVSGAGPKFIKLGSRVLYRQAHLEAFLDERTVSSTSQLRSGP